MNLTEISNWLSFNIYFHPETLLEDNTQYLKWYFKFLKDILRLFLSKYRTNIIFVYFGDYYYKKPVDQIIIDEIDLENLSKELIELKNRNLISQNNIDQMQERFRYIRLRFFINNKRDDIINDFIDQIQDIEYLIGFELVKYDVVQDLGKNFCSCKDEWQDSPTQLERLKYFLEYWNGICRYILTIITDKYYIDFENIDVMRVLHLGFHSLGSKIPKEKCQNCGGILYFLSHYPVLGRFQCNCRFFQGELTHL